MSAAPTRRSAGLSHCLSFLHFPKEKTLRGDRVRQSTTWMTLTLWSIFSFFFFCICYFFQNSVARLNAGLGYNSYPILLFVPVPAACMRMLVGLCCTTGWWLSRYKVTTQDLYFLDSWAAILGLIFTFSLFLTVFAESLFEVLAPSSMWKSCNHFKVDSLAKYEML